MNQENHIRIAAYLREELTSQERERFLLDLKTNPELQTTFNLEQAVFNALGADSWHALDRSTPQFTMYKEALESNQIKHLKELLKAEQAKAAATTSFKLPKWTRWAAAAVIVGLIGLFVFFNKGADSSELYAEYLKLEDIPALAERGSNPKTNLLAIENLFHNKEYKAMLLALKESPEDFQDNAIVQVYTGVGYMQTNQIPEALAAFDGLIASNLMDAQSGYWYKALAYLKNNDLQQAKATLEYIVSNKLFNSEQAKALLAEF